MPASRSLFYLLFFSLTVSAFVSLPENNLPRADVVVRQLPSGSSTSAPASRTDASTTAEPSSASSTPSSSISATSVSSRASSISASNTPTTVPESTEPITSVGIATDSQGHTVTATVVFTPSASASATPTSSQSSSGDAADGLGTGSIIGLSVAGGIAVLIIVAFLVWKLTRKRFGDLDDNEAIKWPELNAHGNDIHALPVHNTGRAGFDTGSEASFSRAPSTDPYAVPPLPHLDPNQPYRDDPSATGYYDPYPGSNPNTFNDADSMDVPAAQGWSNAEAIPMTQMSRARSPGPQMSYDAAAVGRPFPGPQLAYGQGGFIDDRSRSPGPVAGLGGMPPAGRRSPGPQAAYEPSNNIPR